MRPRPLFCHRNRVCCPPGNRPIILPASSDNRAPGPVRRIQFFEIGDLPACPRVVRDAFTDYLQCAQDVFRPYAAIAPLLAQALKRSGARRIVDLCAGGAGSWAHLLPALHAQAGPVSLHLTDKFVNQPAFRAAQAHAPEAITWSSDSIDATHVPEALTGFRTLFSAFHHFPPEAARALLADAVQRGQGIGVFEFTKRSPRGLTRNLALFPLSLLWAFTLRPFRLSRWLLTWLVPIMPFVVLFEGVVSCLRTYTPDELLALAHAADPQHRYDWQAGEQPYEGSAVPATFLIGTPRAKP